MRVVPPFDLLSAERARARVSNECSQEDAGRQSDNIIGTPPSQGSRSVQIMTEGIRDGNEQAFNRFYDLYADRLFRYLLVIAPRDEGQIREALQETMLRVLRYIKPFQQERVFWGWLTRVARTALFDLLRRRKRIRGAESVTWEEEIIELCPDETEAEQSLVRALQTAMAELPRDERELLERHYADGKPQYALAEERGTTPKAIESRLARVRKKMRARILDLLNHE